MAGAAKQRRDYRIERRFSRKTHQVRPCSRLVHSTVRRGLHAHPPAADHGTRWTTENRTFAIPRVMTFPGPVHRPHGSRERHEKARAPTALTVYVLVVDLDGANQGALHSSAESPAQIMAASLMWTFIQ